MTDQPPPAKKHQTTLSRFFVQPSVPEPQATETSSQQQDGNQIQSQIDAASTSTSAALLTSTERVPLVLPLNDIGCAVGCQLTTEDRMKFVIPWCPSSDNEYPSSVRQSDNSTKTGTVRIRRLLPQHLVNFPWLAVSRRPGLEGAFCTPCVLFAAGSKTVKAQALGKFVTRPLTNFDDLTGKNGSLTCHQNNNYHQQSVIAYDHFKQVLVDRAVPDIHSALDDHHKQEVERNRALLKPIVDTVLTCARQNIALRGHRGEVGPVDPEGIDPVENDGNFRALLRLRIRAGDKTRTMHALRKATPLIILLKFRTKFFQLLVS